MIHFLLLLASGSVCSAFLDSLLLIPSNCSQNEFGCANTHCIPIEKRCDEVYDCKDFSDEEDCEFILCKDPSLYKCKNGRCISKLFICDGENDCEDYSDEQNCTVFKESLSSNSSCEENEWRCADRLCILKDWVCNGEEDCLDGSDETIGCTMSIPCDGFKCKNNHCVPHDWRCDGLDDCLDNSDEENCENYIPPKECTYENDRFLCSNNKTCISMSKVCDGKPDCPDNSDESQLCKSTAYSCEHHNCSHTCVQLPTGPKCYCQKGYTSINDKECKDINECEIYGICDQKCVNLPGSYNCYCDNKYILQDDGKTCKAVGGEAMMIFSTKSEIRAYFLQSKLYFPVASHLRQVVGVNYDGNHVYWTDIYEEYESIVKALDDGSERELLVTSGLGTPEDIAVDWLAGNIYFTDAEYKHIGVCTLDGRHCTVLLNKDIRKPRGIVLNIEEGEMFWSDWGNPAEIVRSLMDGSEDRSFVNDNIHWPNGITIDYPNQRLYWTDAKLMTLESIKLDGTDRRIILESVVKHPYSIAVFENRLYWSDWHTHSIQSCDKFTGKNHHTIIKEKKEFIYGLTIFHSSLKKNLDNPCASALCSDICLIKGKNYSCACPDNKVLSDDKHTCKDVEDPQILILGAKNILLYVEHKRLGKHIVEPLPVFVKNIGALAYNSKDNYLFISDIDIKRIIRFNINTGIASPLEIENLGKVTSLDYDFYGNNLYWGDEEKGTIEVINLKNMAHKILLHDLENEIPESICLIPEHGIMFVAFKRKSDNLSHLDRMAMDGTGRTHVVTQGLIGPLDLYYDQDLHRIFFSDAGTGTIEVTSIEGDELHEYQTLDTNPASVTALKDELFWVNEHSKRLYWTNKYNSTYRKKINLEVIPDNLVKLQLISVTPQINKLDKNGCSNNNGNCSHLCLLSRKSFVCACPNNMEFSTNNAQCSLKTTCSRDEFKCQKTNTCIPLSKRCDKNNDCTDGEDEKNCKLETHCSPNQYKCDDGDCIDDDKVCNSVFDCKDKSDEINCKMSKDFTCPLGHFQCSSGHCIPDRFVCDGYKDCSDNMDEANCNDSTCSATQFRCKSGACIPKSWECDKSLDCIDFSDEHPDCEFNTCTENTFTCANGKCVDKKVVCDSVDDCGDDSDEVLCGQQKLFLCRPNSYRCPSNHSICIPKTSVCNGTAECPSKEDELHCNDCQANEFSCKNKKCIPNSWVCDKVDDCGDNSDEHQEACNGHHSEIFFNKLETPCDGFRCKSGHCIDLDLVCNGQQNCYDGSDEGGTCNSTCSTHSNPCSQICVKTPNGPMCKCREGYILKGDAQTCSDINECKIEPPVCSQLCVNKEGGFSCDCYSGFLLRNDRKSCKAEGEPVEMVYTSNNQIRGLSQRKNTMRIIYSDETPRITGLDFSVLTGDVFASIDATGTLIRINENNNIKDTINDIGKPEYLSVDWLTRNVYFFNAKENSKSIDVCNFDDKFCTSIIKIDSKSYVYNLKVDAVNRVLFYAVTTWFIFNSPRHVIYKAYLDGTGISEIVESSPGFITGMACDLYKKQLYFIDQHNREINRINYDGSMKHTVFSNISHPAGLSFFENSLFYLTNNGIVNKCTLFDGNGCETFMLDYSNKGLFIIGQNSTQPIAKNVCAEKSCSYLGLPGPYKCSCICEDKKNGVKCDKNMRMADDNEERSFSIHRKTLDGTPVSDSSSGVTIVSIIVLLVILAGVAYFYYLKKKNIKSWTVGMAFQNASYGVQTDDLDKLVLQSPPEIKLYPGEHEYTNPILGTETSRSFMQRM